LTIFVFGLLYPQHSQYLKFESHDSIKVRGAMAKRSKRATARKVKAGSKAPKKSRAAKKQAAGSPIKAKRKRQKAKTVHKRRGAKKSTSRRRSRTTPRSPVQIETTTIDLVEEPIPGVVVVTEIVETHAKESATTESVANQTTGSESEAIQPS
jgi:hypothetical protein